MSIALWTFVRLLAAPVPAPKSARPRCDEGGAGHAGGTKSLAAAQKLGVGEAFLRYAAADAVMLPENQNAVKGLDGIRLQFARFPAGATLERKLFHADVAASGDFGYTLGTFELRGRGADGQPSVRYGKYCSVLKRQADGSWKWPLDVGTPSPAPK